MASTQLLIVLMIISIVGIFGLTFLLIRYDDVVFKYNKEENDSAPVFIPGNSEKFISNTDSSKIRCDDDNVMCQSPWRCVNGKCEPCTEVKTSNYMCKGFINPTTM